MAEKISTPQLEREYIIPLKREWRKKAYYRRAGRAAKFIKIFIARHMKVPDHDVSKVKLDVYLNNEVWFRGKSSPPVKIKVRARKEGDIVHVSLAETPAHVKFLKLKHLKAHKPVEKAKDEKKSEKAEVKAEAKADEKKTDTPEQKEEKKEAEKEKETSVAEQRTKQAESSVKAQKHTTSAKGESFHRMALKK
jgi:large subunit ribosomal protein L31e